MRTRRQRKFLPEGDYVAEVDVELVETDAGWSPYLSLYQVPVTSDEGRAISDIRLQNAECPDHG